ncbi:DUF2730 family protein [Paracoccus jiaweipingae]|uniref:DUF2730 family protein n=1 Tax=Paracoccus sp. p2-l61 TaxID=3366950 RepID=UPI00379D075B
MTFNFDLTVTLGLVLTLVTALVGWFRMRHAAIDKRIDTTVERLDRHENRLAGAEQTLQQLPGKDDMHALSLALSEIRGDMREMRAAFDGQRQIMSRIESVVSRQEDHLMKGPGR